MTDLVEAVSIHFHSYHHIYLYHCRSPIVVIGRCLGAFSRAYPDPFLEKQLFGFDLDSLLSQLDIASSQGSTAGNVLYVVDIVIPVLSKSVPTNYVSCIIHVVSCIFPADESE